MIISKKYYRFPIYNLPNSLLDIFAKEFIILISAIFINSYELGFFALARILILSPPAILSSFLGQIFYSEFAENFKLGKRNLNALVIGILIAISALPTYIIIGFYSDQIFLVFFGPDWIKASDYFVILLPASFLMLFTAWVDRIFEVTSNQKTSLIIHLVFNLICVSVIFFLFQNQYSFRMVVMSYCLIVFLHELTYLLFAVKLMNLKKNH